MDIFYLSEHILHAFKELSLYYFIHVVNHIIQTKSTTVINYTQVMIHRMRCLHYESISLNYRTLYIRVLFPQLILETRLIKIYPGIRGM